MTVAIGGGVRTSIQIYWHGNGVCTRQTARSASESLHQRNGCTPADFRHRGSRRCTDRQTSLCSHL